MLHNTMPHMLVLTLCMADMEVGREGGREGVRGDGERDSSSVENYMYV